jgi:hypothetical protein
MTKPISVIKLCIDGQDPERLARFWASMLDYRQRTEVVDDGWQHLDPPHAGLPPLTIQPVPEAKAGKNRLHLDVFVADPDEWIAKAEALGARRLWRSEDPDDWFQVLADPEGNEFCICWEPSGSA